MVTERRPERWAASQAGTRENPVLEMRGSENGDAAW